MLNYQRVEFLELVRIQKIDGVIYECVISINFDPVETDSIASRSHGFSVGFPFYLRSLRTLRFFLYFFGLGYMFCGVGVVQN